MKFGKQIQKRQLEVPEYAASFVNYKALKKLIKKLSATPTLGPQNDRTKVSGGGAADSPASLQANRATFFFQLERELEKVNAFYLQKEAELKVRLRTLLDKKQRLLQTRRGNAAHRRSAKFTALDEGFQQFTTDLNKLQQFVEINGTAFSKILKKWDKTSKSKTKELYLTRAVEVQPFFNATVISALSDQATTSMQELGAWSDGDDVQVDVDVDVGQAPQAPDRIVTSQTLVGTDEGDVDILLLDTVLSANIDSLHDLLARMESAASKNGVADVALRERVTRIFLSSINQATNEALQVLLDTGLVDIHSEDDINERNCLHQAAIYGKPYVLDAGLRMGVSSSRTDVYGRVPLHYAALHGRLDMLHTLLAANRDGINLTDHDNFTPLIHAIIHGHLQCVEALLADSAQLDPVSESGHVPLNLACEHGSVPVVELLLKHGAKIVPDAEGLYPQHLVARSKQTPALLTLLMKYGADLDQIDKLYGWTPLIHAASEGNVACLHTVLDAGADPNITDEKDLPAVYYAALEGHLECMKLLSAHHKKKTDRNGSGSGSATERAFPGPRALTTASRASAGTPAAPAPLDADAIPVLELPPPIIPLRRYGHNFLDTKTVVQIAFEVDNGELPLVFFQDGKYPAARLTISSKVSDLIPKNIIFPFQDETQLVSFQVDNLDSFMLDFDVFPTYGAKIIAKAVVPPRIFKLALKKESSGTCCLPLYDPRLRAIGQVTFQIQVVKPFTGKPLELTDFETYWKATSQMDQKPSTVVTGSSLSGDFVRLYVRYTRDRCPVLWRAGAVPVAAGVEIPMCHLTLEQFQILTSQSPTRPELAAVPSMTSPDQITDVHRILSTAGVRLEEALSLLPAAMHVNLEVFHPTPDEEETYALNYSPAGDLNAFADAILSIVFDHARAQRAQSSPRQSSSAIRSIVFSSHSPGLCTALNWKQPNFPVFLCNDLGREEESSGPSLEPGHIQPQPQPCSGAKPGRKPASIKEAVRVAQNNNLMGLVCCGRLLDMVPALVDAIKGYGLALVMDKSSECPTAASPTVMTIPSKQQVPAGIDGVLKNNGVLRFNDCLDI